MGWGSGFHYSINLKDRLQQHSTPSVLLYDQIESVTLVDAKWTQGVQTPNPVALTEFPCFDF